MKSLFIVSWGYLFYFKHKDEGMNYIWHVMCVCWVVCKARSSSTTRVLWKHIWQRTDTNYELDE